MQKHKAKTASLSLVKSALIITMLFAIATNANGKEVRVTGIFSDMHFVEEAGDVTGMEVMIGYAMDGYYAVVQFAEGTPIVPVVVPIKVVNKSSIQFTVPLPNGRKGSFVGMITDDALTLKLENGGEAKLSRRNSYWQQAR